MPENSISGNKLASETSPYLLQHKDNPVHWWPWGEEALAEARRLNRPILLSVGYAACHWCHVMAHESFEDEDTAAVMNDLFVNIKVDREERPDVDALYMAALHNLGEHGGWPLTMFLTENGEPFWGGTYFPREPRFGRPSFVSVLKEVSRVYHHESEKVQYNTTALIDSLKPNRPQGDLPDFSEDAIAQIAERLTSLVDPYRGGIQGAPKFPQSSFFQFLWRAGLRYGSEANLRAVENTLTRICQGGIYDHLGGGIARYSVDERWLVPHFEKMLYDNAQLIGLMTEVWRETQNPLFPIRIEETVDWLLREMAAEGGGFAASLDADSEGEEGKFYVWSKSEIEEILGADDAFFFAKIYDVEEEGNWEGHIILNRLKSLDLLGGQDEERLAQLRSKLMAERNNRIRPGWDDKVLADWNGLMIAALGEAATVFERSDWLGAATRAFDFVVEHMTRDGRLIHSYRGGQAKAPATSNDYANMISAALTLLQSTQDPAYLDQAIFWEAVLQAHYWDNDSQGYFFTADDTSDLIVRTKSAADEATPNANGVMVSNLMALYLLTGDESYQARAGQILKAFSHDISKNIFSYTSLLEASLDLYAPAHVVIIAPGDLGKATDLKQAVYRVSLPGAVVQTLSENDTLPEGSPAEGKAAIDGRPTAYICIGPQCSAPVTSPDELMEVVREARGCRPFLFPPGRGS